VEAVIGAVMAGGSGSRVGGAKALLELRGRPLISYPLAAFDQAGIEAIVVAKRDSFLPNLHVPVWHEPDQPTHPLLGIVTALEQADGRPLLVCACDMPFVTAPLLSYMSVRDGPLVVPRFGGRLHPLCARYEGPLLNELRQGLDPPQPLQEVVASLGPAYLDEVDLRRFGDPAQLLFNVNTDDDLTLAEEIAGS
jgi:molybdopterin-guanine dinucleotide biosynthesis protein A